MPKKGNPKAKKDSPKKGTKVKPAAKAKASAAAAAPKT
jgi:hypothetical protein